MTELNPKEVNAKYVFKLNIRDKEHFYAIVKWLNTNVGVGKKAWSFEGRTLRQLRNGKSIVKKVFIYTDNFAPSSVTYLTLI